MEVLYLEAIIAACILFFHIKVTLLIREKQEFGERIKNKRKKGKQRKEDKLGSYFPLRPFRRQRWAREEEKGDLVAGISN